MAPVVTPQPIAATLHQSYNRPACFRPKTLLGLAGAYALGDTAKARAAYQDFFTLWKDADPDIANLLAAKAEYTKVQ